MFTKLGKTWKCWKNVDKYLKNGKCLKNVKNWKCQKSKIEKKKLFRFWMLTSGMNCCWLVADSRSRRIWIIVDGSRFGRPLPSCIDGCNDPKTKKLLKNQILKKTVTDREYREGSPFWEQKKKNNRSVDLLISTARNGARERGRAKRDKNIRASLLINIKVDQSLGFNEQSKTSGAACGLAPGLLLLCKQGTQKSLFCCHSPVLTLFFLTVDMRWTGSGSDLGAQTYTFCNQKEKIFFLVALMVHSIDYNQTSSQRI